MEVRIVLYGSKSSTLGIQILFNFFECSTLDCRTKVEVPRARKRLVISARAMTPPGCRESAIVIILSTFLTRRGRVFKHWEKQTIILCSGVHAVSLAAIVLIHSLVLVHNFFRSLIRGICGLRGMGTVVVLPVIVTNVGSLETAISVAVNGRKKISDLLNELSIHSTKSYQLQDDKILQSQRRSSGT